MSRATYVLDASAVLALVQGEPGSERVELVVEEAVVSAGNLAEVVGKLIDKGYDGQEVLADLREVGVEVAGLDRAQAEAAGLLRAFENRREPLSLADRLCLALAQARGLPVLTTDARQAAIGMAAGLTVEMIREGRGV